jgi:hypothetical protein
MKLNDLLKFLICILLLASEESCNLFQQDKPIHEIKGEGYARDIYTDSVVPNLQIKVIELIQTSWTTYNYNEIGTVYVDSTGHFTYDFKDKNAGDEFQVQGGNHLYRVGNEILPPNDHKGGIQHFNFLMIPDRITGLHVRDSDIDIFDSIHVKHPMNPKKIIKWTKYVTSPTFPKKGVYPETLEINVLPNRNYKLSWTWFKNGVEYPGKEIDYFRDDYYYYFPLTLSFQ